MLTPRRPIVHMAPLVALCLLLAACGNLLSSVAPKVLITPAPTVTLAHRGPMLVQYCADDTGSYPRGDFSQANHAVADSLVKSVRANSDGIMLYATAITSNTFDPANTLAPFTVPAIANYPTLPTPLPTPSQANPVSFSATATAVENENSTGISAYNATLATVNNTVATVRGQVSTDVARLTNWAPPIDATATSIWGCLQLARQRFTGQPGAKFLIIASDMDNNSSVDYTADFTAAQALKDVNVRVIYYYCQAAGQCQDRANSWTPILHNAGAAAITFDDPAQSVALPSLFGGS
ncbi:MAG TPA: hypothetical protein VGR57_06735 [Ktedonobacterales bacterium]|nr:hypothetical protein [Ktedonobacterales bacterium]